MKTWQLLSFIKENMLRLKLHKIYIYISTIQKYVLCSKHLQVLVLPDVAASSFSFAVFKLISPQKVLKYPNLPFYWTRRVKMAR